MRKKRVPQSPCEQAFPRHENVTARASRRGPAAKTALALGIPA